MYEYCLRGGWGETTWRTNLKIERTFKGMKQTAVIHTDAIPDKMKRDGWRLSSENGKRLRKSKR